MKKKKHIAPVWHHVFHYPDGYSICNTKGQYVRSFNRHPERNYLGEQEPKVVLTDKMDFYAVIPDSQVAFFLRYLNIYYRDYSKLRITNHEDESTSL